MTPSASDVTPFSDQDWSDLEGLVDDRLAVSSGLLGIALIEIDPRERETAVERLVEHLDAEDHTACTDGHRFVIVRNPLTGPAEMEGLGLRIADSFPPASSMGDHPFDRTTVHIGVVTGRRGDKARTLLRHVQFGLEDAKTIGLAMVAVDDGPRLLDSLP